MATPWPTTLPEPFVDFQESWEMPVVETTMEMGIDKARPMFTETPRLFTVTFMALDADEKEDMTDYFQSIGWGGGTITWTHPGTSESIYVKLKGPVVFQHIGKDLWTTTIQFKRVPNAIAV